MKSLRLKRCVLWMLIIGLYSCKTKQYFQAVRVETQELPMEATTGVDTTSMMVSDSTVLEDNWVAMPMKAGEFQNQLRDKIDHAISLRHGFTGFLLKDLEADTMIFNLNEHKYFVSASNTKIFTLFACLKSIKDSLAAFKYVETDTTFTLWGTGDPTLLHPAFEGMTTTDYLKRKMTGKVVRLANSNTLPPYGKGWMWDDYNDSYQAEITTMPIYGNVLSVKQQKNKLSIVPSSPLMSLNIQSDVPYVRRDRDENHFYLPVNLSGNAYFNQEVPYKHAASINTQLLGEIMGVPIDTVQLPLPIVHQTRYSWPLDTVLRRMMQKSDNMLAEHLLINAAMQSIETIQVGTYIQWVKDTYFQDMPQRIYWVDGSGLSRYNRVSPSSIVYILTRMYKEEKKERLFSFFNETKVKSDDGTNRPDKSPIILGKSGSMAGVYNLSGYLVTKSGRTLVFSFMNNNFDTTVRNARLAVEDILNFVVENY